MSDLEGKRIERACLFCGKIFTAQPSKVNRGQYKYCSRKCYGLDRTKHKQPKKQSKPRPYVHERKVMACEICGSFVFDKAQKKYCSKKCASIGNLLGTTKESVCSVCGKKFTHNKYTAGGKYCSLKCFGAHKGQSSMNANLYSRSHGGKRADLNNMYFRSSWEANYARYLNYQIEKGNISSWSFEKKVFEFKTIKRGSRLYIPDFEIVNNDGSVEYHEIKGWMDKVSATKIKRMSKYYPEIKLVVIGKKEYYPLAREFRDKIQGWENDEKHSI